MDWAKPEYDRARVNAAGRKIAAGQGDDDAYQVFNNWRACHSYPLNTFQANLRGKIKRLGIKDVIVSQRIKREASIVGKLKREDAMKLSQMQDIGGLRAVVSTVGEVAKLKDMFLGDKAKHEISKINDYINTPKKSGYRSTHLVFKYSNKKVPQYDDLKIELQLRTRRQHYWANAVETMGTYLRHSLKSSQGPDEWLEFFSLCGEIFARKERTASLEKYITYSNDETLKLFRKMMEELKAVPVLGRLSSVTMCSTEKWRNGRIQTNTKKKLHLIYLNMEHQQTTVEVKSYFHNKESSQANADYAEVEKQIRESGDRGQAVLVNIDSVKDLRKAYPSCFLDAQGFLQEINRIRNAAMGNSKYFAG